MLETVVEKKQDFSRYIFCWDVVNHVREIHSREEDFYEGDLVERIKRFGYYEFKEVSISQLDRGSYYIDEDLVEEYAEKPKETTPAIVLGDVYGGQHDVVDGNHRVESYALKGYEKIWAYVPVYETRFEEDDVEDEDWE